MDIKIFPSFHIVKAIDALSITARGYRYMTLPTEFVVQSPAEIRPELFCFMRYAWTELYYLPSQDRVLPYRHFVDALAKAGIPFNGTYYHRNACDVELWECWGDEGHTDYQHRGNYRIVFERNDPWEFLGGVTGQDFSHALSEKVREFDQANQDATREG